MGFFVQPHHILVALVALTMCTGWTRGLAPVAPPPPVPQLKRNATEEYLLAHNQARAAVGVGPLQWSKKLAKDTNLLVRYQRDKKSCKFADMRLTKYGMNQLWTSGMAVTPGVGVEAWVEKKKYYNHGNNSCAPNYNCGVYKQVVWKKSVEVGCAQATCAKDHATLTICFYHPPGNVIGQSPY